MPKSTQNKRVKERYLQAKSIYDNLSGATDADYNLEDQYQKQFSHLVSLDNQFQIDLINARGTSQHDKIKMQAIANVKKIRAVNAKRKSARRKVNMKNNKKERALKSLHRAEYSLKAFG